MQTTATAVLIAEIRCLLWAWGFETNHDSTAVMPGFAHNRGIPGTNPNLERRTFSTQAAKLNQAQQGRARLRSSSRAQVETKSTRSRVFTTTVQSKALYPERFVTKKAQLR